MASRSLFNPATCISASVSSSSSPKSHQPTQSSQTLLCIPPPDQKPINRRNLLLIAASSSALPLLLMPNSSTSAAAAAAPPPVSISNNIDDQFPRPLDSVIRTHVRRPKKSRSKAEKEAEEEVLVIEQIQLPREAAVKFDVYINNPASAPLPPKDSAEFVGSFVSVPQTRSRAQNRSRLNTYLRLGITDCIEDLGADADDEVEVTLVPRLGTDAVTIGGIKIELLA
ncbi:hypothetical protein ACLOJK_029533 [Asimina triloba]